MLRGLDSASSSWVGTFHASPKLTSALHKKWAEHPNRFILERFLANAHCTPYRLFLMQKRDSPRCPYCLHDCADTPHFLFECPYFAHLRSEAPAATQMQAEWPQCSRACLIYSHNLPSAAKDCWPEIQAWACRLFAMWYHAERQLNAPEKKGLPANDIDCLDFAPPTAPISTDPQPGDPASRSTFTVAPAARIPIKWAPFTSRTQWSKWKASPVAFAQLFLFWSTWRPASNAAFETRYTTWHEALLLYLQFVGSKAFRFGNVSVSQAAFLFKSISSKLLIHCQAISQFADGPRIRWNVDLPLDATITFAHPTLLLHEDMVENLVVLHAEYVQANDATRAYIHAQYEDLIPPDPVDIPSSPPLKFLRRLSAKTSALSWWKFKYDIFSMLKGSNVNFTVKPGAGLAQFPADQLNNIPLEQFQAALGGNFSNTITGIIRRWKLAANSCADVTLNQHVILPIWEDDQWSCLGCKRPANLTRDPLWGTKSCSNPWTQQVNMEPILNTISFLELLFNRLKFCTYSGHLLHDFTPDPALLIQELEDHIASFDCNSFAECIGLAANHPKIPTKKKELLLRWELIQKSWDGAAHTFLPYSLIARDGFCTSCLAAPKNFQAFLRTPCSHHRMDTANDKLRRRFLALHKLVQTAPLVSNESSLPHQRSIGGGGKDCCFITVAAFHCFPHLALITQCPYYCTCVCSVSALLCTYFSLYSVHTGSWLSFSCTLALLLLCSPYFYCVN